MTIVAGEIYQSLATATATTAGVEDTVFAVLRLFRCRNDRK